jgi:hypothetical protein
MAVPLMYFKAEVKSTDGLQDSKELLTHGELIDQPDFKCTPEKSQIKGYKKGVVYSSIKTWKTVHILKVLGSTIGRCNSHLFQ